MEKEKEGRQQKLEIWPSAPNPKIYNNNYRNYNKNYNNNENERAYFSKAVMMIGGMMRMGAGSIILVVAVSCNACNKNISLNFLIRIPTITMYYIYIIYIIYIYIYCNCTLQNNAKVQCLITVNKTTTVS